MEPNILAAFMAASVAFETRQDKWELEPLWFCGYADKIEPAITTAATFIRQWPDAPLDALPIHLKRAGFDVPPIGPREKAAWTVCRTTLMALDAADKEQAAAANPPAPLPGGGIGTVGLKPAPGPFEVTGFSVAD